MASHLKFASNSETATDRFAGLCARAVTTGLTIALSGQLGSGKTRFVRAFCDALGVDPAAVTSPTFVLLQLYESDRWTICHFDTYRLADEDEFLALGAEDYLTDPQYICLIEWADRVTDILPPDCLTLRIQHTAASERLFDLTAGGPCSETLLASIEDQLRSS